MYTFEAADNLDIKELFDLYSRYSNQELPNIYAKFSFGREIFARASALAMLGAAVAACSSSPKVEVLTPIGQQISGPAIVQAVAPNLSDTKLTAVRFRRIRRSGCF